jgi:hypothetical protein
MSADLNNSFLIAWGRRMRGEKGEAFLKTVLEMIAASNSRLRARRPIDDLRHRETISAMLANIVGSALNELGDNPHVVVPYRNEDYTGLEVSRPSAEEFRDTLLETGWLTPSFEPSRRPERCARLPAFSSTLVLPKHWSYFGKPSRR